jgi:hypothetical protein
MVPGTSGILAELGRGRPVDRPDQLVCRDLLRRPNASASCAASSFLRSGAEGLLKPEPALTNGPDRHGLSADSTVSWMIFCANVDAAATAWLR